MAACDVGHGELVARLDHVVVRRPVGPVPVPCRLADPLAREPPHPLGHGLARRAPALRPGSSSCSWWRGRRTRWGCRARRSGARPRPRRSRARRPRPRTSRGDPAESFSRSMSIGRPPRCTAIDRPGGRTHERGRVVEVHQPGARLAVHEDGHGAQLLDHVGAGGEGEGGHQHLVAHARRPRSAAPGAAPRCRTTGIGPEALAGGLRAGARRPPRAGRRSPTPSEGSARPRRSRRRRCPGWRSPRSR